VIQAIEGEDSFQTDVLEAKVPVLVDFWAKWCAPCLAAAPVLEELSKDYQGRIAFAKVDVDGNSSLAVKYGIAAIPTMLLFKNGKPVEQVTGYKSKKDLKKVLDGVL